MPSSIRCSHVFAVVKLGTAASGSLASAAAYDRGRPLGGGLARSDARGLRRVHLLQSRRRRQARAGGREGVGAARQAVEQAPGAERVPRRHRPRGRSVVVVVDHDGARPVGVVHPPRLARRRLSPSGSTGRCPGGSRSAPPTGSCRWSRTGRGRGTSTTGDLDWNVSDAAPPALRGVFREEPRHLDLRWARDETHLDLRHSAFRDAIAQLAAPIRGIPKDELEGEDIRLHRRARTAAPGRDRRARRAHGGGDRRRRDRRHERPRGQPPGRRGARRTRPRPCANVTAPCRASWRPSPIVPSPTAGSTSACCSPWRVIGSVRHPAVARTSSTARRWRRSRRCSPRSSNGPSSRCTSTVTTRPSPRWR